MVGIIKYKGEAFDLEPNITIRLKSEGSFFAFGLKARYSLPFKMPASEKNKRLFSNYQLIDSVRQYKFIPVTYQLLEGDIIESNLKFEWADSSFSCTLFTADVELLTLFKNTKIHEIDPVDVPIDFINQGQFRRHRKVLKLPDRFTDDNSLFESYLDWDVEFVVRGNNGNFVNHYNTYNAKGKTWAEIVGFAKNGGDDGTGVQPATFTFADAFIDSGYLYWVFNNNVDPGYATGEQSSDYRVFIRVSNGVLPSNYIDYREEIFYFNDISSLNLAKATGGYDIDNSQTNEERKICFPVMYSPELVDTPTLLTSLESSTSKYISGIKRPVLNEFGVDPLDPSGNTYGFRYDSLSNPAFFLKYILIEIGRSLGFTVSGSFMDDIQSDMIIIRNPVCSEWIPVFKLNDYLPDVTIAKFLEAVSKAFCLDIGIDSLGNAITLNYKFDMKSKKQTLDGILSKNISRKIPKKQNAYITHKDSYLNMDKPAGDVFPVEAEIKELPIFQLNEYYPEYSGTSDQGPLVTEAYQDELKTLDSPERFEDIIFSYFLGNATNGESWRAIQYFASSYRNSIGYYLGGSEYPNLYSLSHFNFTETYYRFFIENVDRVNEEVTLKGVMSVAAYNQFKAGIFEFEGVEFITVNVEAELGNDEEVAVEIECYRIG